MRTIALVVAACAAAPAVMAHEIIVSSTVSGGELQVAIESTHVFVAPEELENAEAVTVTITTPDGRSTAPVSAISDLTLGAAAAAPQSDAWLTVHRLGQVWSNTPDGWRQGDAAAYPDAVFTNRYEKFAKALVRGETTDAAFATAPLGHALEIVPLVNPADLSVGDDLPVRVLHDGAPVSGELRATYAGFSDAPMTFAYATEVDANGEAAVKLWAPGYWYVRVAHDAADVDPNVQTHVLRAILSFDVE